MKKRKAEAKKTGPWRPAKSFSIICP